MTIRFASDGRDSLLRTEQVIPRPLGAVFPFFADAHNLERLTPPNLRFRILTPGPIEMRTGTLIDYRVSLRGVPMRWRTRISEWDPPHRFEDTQLRGPYALWVHSHVFEPHPDGTLMTDLVRYRAPLGPLGRVTDALIIRRDLRRIFAYRRRAVEAAFPSRDAFPSGPACRASEPLQTEYAADLGS